MLDNSTRCIIVGEMERLRQHIDALCVSIRQAPPVGYVINCDLTCVAAAFGVNSNGDTFTEAYIEGADPMNAALHAAIRAECQSAGWGDVIVITSW